ncbi:hypothetical protein [Sulfitobacter aestuariivivens]|uniref:hypothetical protein n=1 Tax=Sulfitobacter aestuariivivens TaxID=2766981 RepID=UPI003614DBED
MVPLLATVPQFSLKWQVLPKAQGGAAFCGPPSEGAECGPQVTMQLLHSSIAKEIIVHPQHLPHIQCIGQLEQGSPGNDPDRFSPPLTGSVFSGDTLPGVAAFFRLLADH